MIFVLTVFDDEGTFLREFHTAESADGLLKICYGEPYWQALSNALKVPATHIPPTCIKLVENNIWTVFLFVLAAASWTSDESQQITCYSQEQLDEFTIPRIPFYPN